MTVCGPLPADLCVDSAWRTLAALALACAADAGDASALGPLADALEEAGCPAEEVCPTCKGSGGTGYGKFGVCPVCRGTGHVPNPLLAHLRQSAEVLCPACRGCGWEEDERAPEGALSDCPTCHGTGRIAQPHALPGCWAISLLLNKE